MVGHAMRRILSGSSRREAHAVHRAALSMLKNKSSRRLSMIVSRGHER